MDFEYVSRHLSGNGAEVFIFPTMDFPVWNRIQEKQHAAMTALRAVENRRYIFRVASSGISQVVNAHGRILHEISPGVKDFITANVLLLSTKTFYQKTGFLIGPICLGITIFIIISLAFLSMFMGRNLRRIPMKTQGIQIEIKD